MPLPRYFAVDPTTGQLEVNGCVFTYQSGTATPLQTYADASGNIVNPNPVKLDSGGSASIWLVTGLAYTITLWSDGSPDTSNCANGAQIWTQSNVTGIATQPNQNYAAVTTVSFSATPTFTALAQNQLFKMTLTGNVTSSSISMSGISVPALVTFELTQDGTGGRTFTWPGNVVGGAQILTAANAITTQAFYWDGTDLYPMVGSGSIPFPDSSFWSTGGAAFNGSGTITSTPPIPANSTNGWKMCMYGTDVCLGVGSFDWVFYSTASWLSLFSSLPNNNASPSTPDTAAGISFSPTGEIVGPGGSTNINIVPGLEVNGVAVNPTAYIVDPTANTQTGNSGTGPYTMTSDTISAGVLNTSKRSIHVFAAGCAEGATNSVAAVLILKIAGITFASSSLDPGGASCSAWTATADCTVTTTGSSGAMQCSGNWVQPSQGNPNAITPVAAASATVNLTLSQTVSTTVSWGSGNTSNSATTNQLTVTQTN